jgi:hypothetical protein
LGMFTKPTKPIHSPSKLDLSHRNTFLQIMPTKKKRKYQLDKGLNVGWFHSPSKLDLFDRSTLLQIMPTKTEMSTDNSLNFECWMVCKSLILFPVQGNFKLHNPTCIVFACCKAFVQDLDGNEKIGDFFDILHTQVV